jgi:hypothetical protein
MVGVPSMALLTITHNNENNKGLGKMYILMRKSVLGVIFGLFVGMSQQVDASVYRGSKLTTDGTRYFYYHIDTVMAWNIDNAKGICLDIAERAGYPLASVAHFRSAADGREQYFYCYGVTFRQE